MSEQERWPRPLRTAFRIAMREKPPEVFRNKEFLEELLSTVRDLREGRADVAEYASMEDFIAALHDEVAQRQERGASSA